MNMKKLLISLLAGSVILGVGIGVTALEVSMWDTADHPAYLENKTVQTEEIVEKVDVTRLGEVNVYVSGLSNGFRNDGLIEIVEDETCSEKIVVKIDYKGSEPYTSIYDFDYEDENGEMYRNMDIVVHPDYNYSLRQIREVAEEMFENKVFYTSNVSTLVEKVTVYTATPEKFDINI